MGMVDHGQTNIRVPEDAKDTLKELARRLRDDEKFLPRLKRFLEEDADGGRSAFLTERLDRLERRVAELEGSGNASPRATAAPRQVDMFGHADKGKPRPTSEPAPGALTKGEGRGRRLTDAGLAELRRRIEAGETDKMISDALGIRPYTVANQRKQGG